jgi:hypothetical protein
MRVVEGDREVFQTDADGWIAKRRNAALSAAKVKQENGTNSPAAPRTHE